MEELCSALLLVAEMQAAPVTECCVFFFVCLFLSEARCVEKQEKLTVGGGRGRNFYLRKKK